MTENLATQFVENSGYHFRSSSFATHRRDPEHVYKMSLCFLHEHAPPEHDRYNLEFFYQSRIHCFLAETCLFVVFSLFTSFCRDTSCQAHPFCRENIVPLYNLSGSNLSRVNSREAPQDLPCSKQVFNPKKGT